MTLPPSSQAIDCCREMSCRKLLFVLLSVTVVLGQLPFDPSVDTDRSTENEVSDDVATKKCPDRIRVYHGKILVNTRIQTGNDRKRRNETRFLF